MILAFYLFGWGVEIFAFDILGQPVKICPYVLRGIGMQVPRFEFGEPVKIIQGLTSLPVHLLKGEQESGAVGRVVSIDLKCFHTTIFPFDELINKNFNPQWRYSPPPEVNCGVNVPQFLRRAKPEVKRELSRFDIQRCMFCCNTTHANFVRGNAFVIINGKLVYKPVGAVALDGETYRSLGYHPDNQEPKKNTFAYQSLIITAGGCYCDEIRITNNILEKTDKRIQLAISGPFLVRNGSNVTENIPIRKNDNGQTFGNELNYCPLKERSSFTVFGVGKERGTLLAATMFAGAPGKREDDVIFFAQNEDDGITLFEMGELMISEEVGASNVIVGGGSGDAQQYLHRKAVYAGQPRNQPDRPQVDGLRGLGAILAVFTKVL